MLFEMMALTINTIATKTLKKKPLNQKVVLLESPSFIFGIKITTCLRLWP